MGAGPNGCQYHSGIVNEDETLTKIAVNLFIADVKKELTLGSDGYTPVFPCGPKIAVNPYASALNLEDEKAFPDFHQNVIRGQYQKIAAALNVVGGYTILPICDPFALAASLGIDLDLDLNFPDGFLEFLIPNLPKLAVSLNIMPPVKLAAKLPGLLQVPPKLPKFTVPPIPKPALNFVPGLNADLAFAAKLPQLILQIIAKIPGLVLDIPNMPSAICNLAFQAGLFGDVPGATVRLVATKVLIKKITEMVMILSVGKVVGSSPDGIVGGLGTKLGYIPPGKKHPKQPKSPREKIVAYAEDCIDLAWGISDKRDSYVQRLLYTEYGDGIRKDNLPDSDPEKDPRVIGKTLATNKASAVSSCGMFARACCFAGGASYAFKYRGQPLLNKNPKIGRYYDFFADEYRLINGSGIAISGLLQAAKAKEATIQKVKGDLPSLQKGDIIIVYDPVHAGREHVMLVVENYEAGSFELTTIEGGQTDPKNKNKPTAIKKKTYRSPSSPDFKNKSNQLDPPYGFEVNHQGVVTFSGRQILSMIDGEKLCTSDAGSNTSDPNHIFSPEFFDNNDPAADEAAGLLPITG
jgi:hypothetical protein